MGDRIQGGLHCHGHDHGPQPSPGRIVSGSKKVFVEGRPAARLRDPGHSPMCCGGVGTITLFPRPGRVHIDGRPVATVGDPTSHCGLGFGTIATGSSRVFVI
jgi:uncharacterized Zn-binding protein involved in type VI secretion